MGNIVNEKYYMVFDMSPYDEKNMNFLQMGFGVVNSRGIVLEKQQNVDPTPTPTP